MVPSKGIHGEEAKHHRGYVTVTADVPSRVIRIDRGIAIPYRRDCLGACDRTEVSIRLDLYRPRHEESYCS